VLALISGGALSVILLVAAPQIASSTFANAALTGALRVSAALVFLAAIAQVQIGALAGFQAFRSISIAGTLAGAIALPAIALGAYGMGLDGAVAGLVIAAVSLCAVNHVLLRQQCRAHGVRYALLCDRPTLRMVLAFSIPALLASSLVGPVNWLCVAIVARQPNGLFEAGLFNAANQWRIVILYIPAMLGTVALPALSAVAGRGEHGAFARNVRRNVVANGALAIVAASVVALLATPLMALYGDEFQAGTTAVVLLAGAAAPAAVAGAIGVALAAAGMMWHALALNATWAVVLLGSAWVMASGGATGLAWANVVAYVAHAALAVAVWRHCERRSSRFAAMPPSLTPAGIPASA